jgi:hypothetical protein
MVVWSVDGSYDAGRGLTRGYLLWSSRVLLRALAVAAVVRFTLAFAFAFALVLVLVLMVEEAVVVELLIVIVLITVVLITVVLIIAVVVTGRPRGVEVGGECRRAEISNHQTIALAVDVAHGDDLAQVELGHHVSESVRATSASLGAVAGYVDGNEEILGAVVARERGQRPGTVLRRSRESHRSPPVLHRTHL